MNDEHIRKISEAITVVETNSTPYMWEVVPRIGTKPLKYNWAWEVGPRRYFSVSCEIDPEETTVTDGRRYLYVSPQSTTLIWEGAAIPLQTTAGQEVSFEEREFHLEHSRPIDGLGALLRSAIEAPVPL